ncbi:putative methionine transporter, NhaC family [Microbulbifer donghaiensis]|uniref:Putative methionine transporter, NhaC family n=2 Tax=Microbulbifer donghaiensis TaxID=494016 RepID=A0A1M4XIH2_9GAMM|nr:putative methionine transporter, NhaC family [Microbulbifer donghaiensis]
MTKATPLALLPLALFLALFVGSGLWYQSQGVEMAFYQISAPVAILPAIALALLLARGSLNRRIETFIHGVGDHTIVTMALIYLLAGGFASVAKAIGGVDATVNFGLSVIPAELVLPGLFLITAFVATAMGTSMGTVAAIAPIAVGVADATDLPLLLTVGTVVGGAMFGDNLSIISDTTIAATRTQGVEMRDKFRMNVRIAMPAAVLTLAWLYFQSIGQGATTAIAAPGDYELLRLLPYVAVLVLAVAGVNVLLVLFTGILLAGAIGLGLQPEYSLASLSRDIYAGYSSMQEILLLSLLIGGLGAMMKTQGGLAWLANAIDHISRSGGRRERNARSGELGISAAVALTNVCTANNTVAILLSGSLAKDIAARYRVDPRRSASLLDIFSCAVQGLLPYGAQVLLASSLARVSPLALVSNIQYCWLLGAAALISIVIGAPRFADLTARRSVTDLS